MANTIELKQQIAQGEYDAAFAKLYGADAVQEQRKRYTDLIDEFEKKYGTNRTVRLYSAPGRTEIGGNHTDHNNGVVLAGSVNLDIVAIVSPNDENIIRVKSLGFEKIDDVDVTNLVPQEQEKEHSAALIRGVAAGIVNAGGKVGGFDAYTTSNVLRGSGLSSSAAFEVCIGAILRGEYNDNDMEKFSQVKIAQIGQYAENVFFDKPCGLMDQTACAVGKVITIDFKEVGHPVVREVPFDLAAKGFALCISDTKGSHADLTDDYAAVRREMESVAEFFGKKVLRDVDEETFLKAIPEVRKVTGDRAVVRAIHFYNDSRRAGEIYEAIKADDFDRFLQLCFPAFLLQPPFPAFPSVSRLVLDFQKHQKLQLPIRLFLGVRRMLVCKDLANNFFQTADIFIHSGIITVHHRLPQKQVVIPSCALHDHNPLRIQKRRKGDDHILTHSNRRVTVFHIFNN